MPLRERDSRPTESIRLSRLLPPTSRSSSSRTPTGRASLPRSPDPEAYCRNHRSLHRKCGSLARSILRSPPPGASLIPEVRAYIAGPVADNLVRGPLPAPNTPRNADCLLPTHSRRRARSGPSRRVWKHTGIGRPLDHHTLVQRRHAVVSRLDRSTRAGRGVHSTLRPLHVVQPALHRAPRRSGARSR